MRFNLFPRSCCDNYRRFWYHISNMFCGFSSVVQESAPKEVSGTKKLDFWSNLTRKFKNIS